MTDFKKGDFVYYFSEEVYGIIRFVTWGLIGIRGLDGEHYEVTAKSGQPDRGFFRRITEEEFLSAEILDA